MRNVTHTYTELWGMATPFLSTERESLSVQKMMTPEFLPPLEVMQQLFRGRGALYVKSSHYTHKKTPLQRHMNSVQR